MTTITKVTNNIKLLGSYFEANRIDGGGFAVVRKTHQFDNSLTEYYNNVVGVAKELMNEFKELSKEEWRSALNQAIEAYNLVAFGAKVRSDSEVEFNDKSIDKCMNAEAILLVGIALDFIKDDEYNGFLTVQDTSSRKSNIPFNVLAH
jgi:hypothetical protein